jgi:hypothetical protein
MLRARRYKRVTMAGTVERMRVARKPQAVQPVGEPPGRGCAVPKLDTPSGRSALTPAVQWASCSVLQPI